MKKFYSFVILIFFGITQIYSQCLQCTGTTALGAQATSVGTGTTANGANSFAGGNYSAVSNTSDNSFAFGNYSNVFGLNGIALGNYAKVNVNSTNGIAIGNFVQANALNSFVFGMGTSSAFLTNSKANSIMFGVSNKPTLTIFQPLNADRGYLGIGTDSPKAMAHVVGTLLIDRTEETASSLRFQYPSKTKGIDPGEPQIGQAPYCWDIYSDINGLKFNVIQGVSAQRMIINSKGFVGIGKDPSVMLDVNGDAQINGVLCAKEVLVKFALCWPDYVFNKDYKLLPLTEVEQFITENQHLPNVPSAAEVEANGVELGEMNAILLQKVEELTLYIIQLQKQIDELKPTAHESK
jgi:hypothetical protein